MPRLFISHSSRNDDWALALRDWLVDEGWSGKDDIFLDVDPERGIAAGQRWVHALEEAATRCEAVLFVVSREWLASKWCVDEYQLANKLNKKLFALLIDDSPLDRLPGGLTAQWQVVRFKGEPAERFLTVHPFTQHQSPVHIAEAGLASLKRGLEKAGVGPETFELQRDRDGPFGWRAPYRGLEALEPEDAAVFFGRNADIVRGIDALRGLAARKPPRLLVILGASGAGKSSFLRAGLWPRLNRDDSQWLPLRAIRAGRGGAIEGGEGLLAALEEVYRRFDLPISRAELRRRLAMAEQFIELLRGLRQAAAKRALLSELPLAMLCLDQAEEVFTADAGAESDKFLGLARAAIDSGEALLLVTIRSDAYGLMQSVKALAGIDQVPLSLGPVPDGEIAHLIREPAVILRGKAGPSAPVFDAAVVERLQSEIAGEADALPLLAFVLQRLMREHAGAATIGAMELEQTGGVAAAIESAAEAALADAGYGADRARQRDVLRRLFIPRLARIDRESKAAHRRVARQSDLPADLLPLARALTERRLLVAKLAARTAERGAATLEVAHEALLRRWPTLADLLKEDRDALLLLDGVVSAAADWNQADVALKPDFLAHRGSRLSDALALAARGPDWAREIAVAQEYLAACQAREAAEREEKEAALAREHQRLAEVRAEQARTARMQRRAALTLAALAVVMVASLAAGGWLYWTNIQRQEMLDRTQEQLASSQQHLDRSRVNVLARLAAAERLRGNFDSALRLSVHAARQDLQNSFSPSLASAVLATTVWHSNLGLVLTGHDGPVFSAAFSSDGTRIVTASKDGTARVWDAASGREIVLLRGHDHLVRSAAFSRDGTRIVTASADSTARIWDAATGREIAVLRGHGGPVQSAAFSRDGTRIVTASSDRTARVWEVASGREMVVLHGHDGEVWHANFNPDGTRIVTASPDKTARVWDSAAGNRIAVLRGHDDSVRYAAFSRDGTRIVTASEDKTARIWDATGTQIAALRGHDSWVLVAAFSPDQTRIVTASADQTARIWDVATGKETVTLRGHNEVVWSAVFDPDGTRIVTSSHDQTTRVWDAVAGKPIAVLRGHQEEVTSVAFDSGGTRIVTGSEDGTARVWDAVSGDEIRVLRGDGSNVEFAAFTGDGTRIVMGSVDRTARVWDARTGKEIMALRGHEGTVFSAAFSPDGTRIVTASYDKTARIWDVASGSQIMSLRGHENWVNSAAFSRDGTRVVTASQDKTARIWDAVSGSEVAILHGAASMYSAAFSPDGTRVVTASADKTTRMWDAATGQEIAVLRGHDNLVQSAAFSPDGRRIVTASFDTTARIWDAATGEEIAVLRGHDGHLRSAAFGPNGTHVVTASKDKTARIWDVTFATAPTVKLVEEVCLRRLRGLTSLTRDEMRLAGYAEDVPSIDVCAGVRP